MVRNPVTAQAAINKTGEPTSRAISAETRKIPEPIIEPITSMVELVRPRPWTNSVEDGLTADELLVCAALVSTVRELSVVRGSRLVICDSWLTELRSSSHDSRVTKHGFPQLYPRILKNSSADLRGSRTRSDITATESAPASITDRQFARVMPPIATSGLRVSSRARRTPANPI